VDGGGGGHWGGKQGPVLKMSTSKEGGMDPLSGNLGQGKKARQKESLSVEGGGGQGRTCSIGRRGKCQEGVLAGVIQSEKHE